MRRAFTLVLLLTVTGAVTFAAFRRDALTVVRSGPVGEIRQLQDANEIQIVFSEPMVALGRIPTNPEISWVTIEPSMAGAWRWSGTTILIFTPDPDTPLPYATQYTVTVDETAESAAGDPLGSAHAFSFTTPTVRLTSARWARQQNRFDQPLAVVLRFNQPVRAADVLAHVTARYRPYVFAAPELTSAERSRLLADDPAGVERFDAKVATARQTAARRDAVPLRLARDWDRNRFPDHETQIVLETAGAPPPGARLDIIVDTAMPSPAGPETPPDPQTSLLVPDPVFFAVRPRCRTQCNPSGRNGVIFSGQVEAADFATALSVTDITDPTDEQSVAPTETVAAAGLDTSTLHGVDDGGFQRQPPAHTWALTLDDDLEAVDGQTLGYPWVGIIENWHERAFTSFGDGHGVWESSGGSQLPFYARNYQTVRQHLVPLTARELMPRILELQRRSFEQRPAGAGSARRLAVEADAIQSHGLDLRSVLSAGGTGLAWAAIEPGETIDRSSPLPFTRSTVVQVTNLGLTVKDSPQSTLVFVTALDSGEPVADAGISIINTDNTVVWRGVTNADGIVLAPALPLRTPDRWWEFSFLVMAHKDGDVAYVGSDWTEGIESWSFGSRYDIWEATDILRGSVFSDRGVYRPGEDVRVKTIARLDTPTGIRMLPADSALEVTVTDGRGREVDNRQVTVGEWSSSDWSWTVPEDATLGTYNVDVSIPGTRQPAGNDATERRREADWLHRVSGAFTVAAYRRPDFRVDTTFAAAPAVAGATLRATLDARYLFGSALGGRPVRWSVRRDLAYDVPAAILETYPRNRYAFGYSPQQTVRADPRVAGDEATLDADGRMTASYDTDAGTDLTYRYTFEGDVEDVSRQHMANRSSVVVYPAPWHIGIRRPPYFAEVANGTQVDVVAVGPDGRARAGVPVTLQLVRVQWNSVRRAEGSGFYTWETERIEIPSGEWMVQTADTPTTVRIPLGEGGSYQLRAVAEADGRRTRTDVSFYALGEGYTAWRRYDHNRITVEPERATWRPGERARFMIQSPWETATALLTVEREGIRHYERFDLTSTQQTVEVALTEDDIPNLYVSVLLIRGRTSDDPGAEGDDPGKPAFRLGYAQITVEDATKQLSVDVSADREEYRPANTARVSVSVRDHQDRPAVSEVTLWAVDYGVLSLTGYQAPDVLRSIYQPKALQVMNLDSRQRIISRRVLTPKGDTDGGGGGLATDARRDFRPLAFWLGSVETDASGRAMRDVTLPESLTTYRIMAVAGDRESRFGADDTEIRVSKPLTLLPAFPRFLSLGDTASFGGVVTNTLAAGGDATVTIESLDPEVLAFGDDGRSVVALGGGASEAVRFEATARAVGTARVRMRVGLGDNTDAFETTLPVHAPARPIITAAFGDTTDRVVERLTLPAGILPSRGGLTIDLASSALVGLGEGARYLADYPYFCAEQKASSALALALAADLGDAFSMGNIAPADYRVKAESLLNELPRYQCADGGFGYWPGGCLWGQVYLTSYVLHVMHVTQGLGFELDTDVVNRALTFLENETRKSEPQQVQWLTGWGATQAYAVKMLVAFGRNQDSNITRLFQTIDRLPVFGVSYLADAMQGARAGDPRYSEVMRRLQNAMRIEGDRAHVEELDEDALTWLWNSNVRSTSVVLDGLARRGGDQAMSQRAVRWLLAARENGRWRNTQENATALLALVNYYKAFEQDVPDMTASVTLAGQALGTARFEGRSATAQRVQLAMPDLLRRVAAGAEADLAIARAGTGRLYYTARTHMVPTTPPPPSEQGIRVARRYARYAEDGDGPAATAFDAGDLIRVTLTVTLPTERRFVAVTDTMPAGVEAVDAWFRTTASDLARDASTQSSDESWEARWRRGGFEHIEKYDDRVALFATRLSAGRHEFSYVVRATTAGTYTAPGAWAEEMYAPEVNGQSAPDRVVIR